jgi:hypothetical protein
MAQKSGTTIKDALTNYTASKAATLGPVRRHST